MRAEAFTALDKPSGRASGGKAAPTARRRYYGTGLNTPLPTGQVLPADQIKGRMILREVSDQCAVPIDQLLATLNLPPNTDPNVAIRDLISQGMLSEVTIVKDAVAKLQE